MTSAHEIAAAVALVTSERFAFANRKSRMVLIARKMHTMAGSKRTMVYPALLGSGRIGKSMLVALARGRTTLRGVVSVHRWRRHFPRTARLPVHGMTGPSTSLVRPERSSAEAGAGPLYWNE